MENELPEGWEYTTVEEISDRIHYGYTASSTFENTGVQLLRITDIQDNKVDWNSVPYCEISQKDSEKYLLKEGDLVFARTGATVGKSFLLKNDVPNSVFASYLIRISKSIDKNYLYYFFNTNDYWQQITDGARGIGQPNVNAQTLSQIKLPIAPLAEQKRIVAKLDAAFGHLERLKTSLNRIPELLKKFRQNVLTQAVTGKLTEDWREKNPDVESAGSSLKNAVVKRALFYNEQLKHANKVKAPKPNKPNYLDYSLEADSRSDITLPDKWIVAKVGLLCDCIVPGRDKPKSFTGDIPWITMPDVTDEDVLQISKSGLGLSAVEIKEVNARVIPAESIVMSCIGRFGIAAYVATPIVINQQLHAFLKSDLIQPKYLMYHIRTLEAYMNFTATSTTIAYLNKTNCNSLPINLPPLEEQQEIVKQVEALFAQADVLEAQYESLKAKIEKLPQALLAKAFRGELVPQDPTDEPASVLLEKIKAEAAKGSKKKEKNGQVELAF